MQEGTYHELLRLPNDFSYRSRIQVEQGFKRIYEALGLDLEEVHFTESPLALQLAIKQILGKNIPDEWSREHLVELDYKTDPGARANAKVWELVGNTIARSLLVAFGSKEGLDKHHRQLSPSFQSIEDAVSSEISRRLNQIGIRPETPAHHPNYFDHKWLDYYKQNHSNIPLAGELATILNLGLMQAFCFDKLVLWCPKPKRLEFSEGYLHNEEGPAMYWNDSFQLFYWRGVKVPQKLILNPESINRDDIDSVRNAEVRRCFQEKLGTERFASLFDLEVIDQNVDYQGNPQYLYRSRDIDPIAREYLQFAKVICPTTYREYFLCVPPDIKRVQEAVAWTFSKDEEEYRPEQEV